MRSCYSTVTDLARLRGWSTSSPLCAASSSEQLQRDDGQQRLQQGGDLRQPDEHVGVRLDHRVALLGQHDRACAAGPDLLDPADHLVVQEVAPARGHHAEHRQLVLDQGDRAVLELAGRTLGVDVGELLELQRPLERDRVAHVAAQEQHRAGVGEPAGEPVDLLGPVEHLLDLVGDVLDLVDHLGDLVAVPGAADLRQVEPEQVAGDELGGEALRRGDPDLRAGVGVDHRVGLARDRGAVGVADREHLGALLAGVPDRHQRVGGLAGLADRHHQGGPGQDQVAVAELRGELHLAGDPGPVLDRVLRDHAGVERGAARDHDDLVDLAQLLLADPDLVELEGAVLVVAAEQGVGDGARLLEDLLAHEPVVAVLLRRGEVPVDVVRRRVRRRAVEVGDLDALAGDRDDLVLAELEGLARVLDERGHVGGEEVLAVTDAHDERGVAAGGDDPVGVLPVHGDEGERALEAAAHALHALGEVHPAGQLDLEQVEATSVSVSESRSCPASSSSARSRAKFSMIPLCTRATRRRWPRCGCALRSLGRRGWPSGCARCRSWPPEGVVGERLVEVGQLPGPLLRGDAAGMDQGDSGRVVAAVLEAPEPLDHDALRLLRSHVSHDSAHGPHLTGGRSSRLSRNGGT